MHDRPSLPGLTQSGNVRVDEQALELNKCPGDGRLGLQGRLTGAERIDIWFRGFLEMPG